MVFAAYSFQNVFQYEEKDIYWCTADVGWITGHTILGMSSEPHFPLDYSLPKSKHNHRPYVPNDDQGSSR
jgi:hypothetical protein